MLQQIHVPVALLVFVRSLIWILVDIQNAYAFHRIRSGNRNQNRRPLAEQTILNNWRWVYFLLHHDLLIYFSRPGQGTHIDKSHLLLFPAPALVSKRNPSSVGEWKAVKCMSLLMSPTGTTSVRFFRSNIINPYIIVTI
jgi:hypothetical protein